MRMIRKEADVVWGFCVKGYCRSVCSQNCGRVCLIDCLMNDPIVDDGKE